MAEQSFQAVSSWPDDDTWLAILEPACTKDEPNTAEIATRVWHLLLELMAQGPQGIKRAKAILEDALRVIYLLTPSYQSRLQTLPAITLWRYGSI